MEDDELDSVLVGPDKDSVIVVVEFSVIVSDDESVAEAELVTKTELDPGNPVTPGLCNQDELLCGCHSIHSVDDGLSVQVVLFGKGPEEVFPGPNWLPLVGADVRAGVPSVLVPSTEVRFDDVETGVTVITTVVEFLTDTVGPAGLPLG